MSVLKPFKDEDVVTRVEIVQTKENKVYVAYPAGPAGIDQMMDPVMTLKLLGAGIKILGDTLQKQLQDFANQQMAPPPGAPQVIRPMGIEAPDPGQPRIIVPHIRPATPIK